MVTLPALPVGNALLSEAILVILIALVLFIIFKLGKSLLKIIFGLIANSILGILAIFILDYFFSIGIPLEVATLVPTALFGLPAVGTLILLRFFGIPL
jgi:SigmaK-factor processing regulatory protein BofA